jgi:hypothetical protein
VRTPLYADGVRRVWQRLEFGDLRGREGAALQREAAHRPTSLDQLIHDPVRATILGCPDRRAEQFD